MLHNKKLLALIITGILLVALPIFIVIVQRSQENRSRANAATTLTLNLVPSPSKPTITVNDPLTFTLKADPGTTNLLSVISFVITYDKTKVKPTTTPFTLNSGLTGWKAVTPIQVNETTGTISGSYSVGADPTKAIQRTTDVGTFSFTAIAGTEGQTTTIGFANNTAVYSLSSKDVAQENVLASTTPATFVITSTVVPTPTPPAKSATIVAAPSSGTYKIGDIIPMTVTINGGGQAFNAAQSTVALSSNLQITALTPGNCNFQYVMAPTTQNASFVGAILATSSQSCTIYTLSLKVLSSGTGTVTFSNNSIKSYATSSELFSTVVNPSLTLTTLPVTPSPIPTATPTPIATATPTPVARTSYIAMILGLHGIGYAGDNANPGKIVSFSSSNPAPTGDGAPATPLHTSRQASLQFYDGQNILLYTIPVTVVFSPDTYSFGSIFQLTPAAVSVIGGKTVSIRVSVPQYLTHVYPLVTIKDGATTNLSYVPLITGNVYSDSSNQNQLDILDYNAIMDCREDVDTVNKTGTCSVNADINDDGHVDVKDYQLLIRELSVQTGR